MKKIKIGGIILSPFIIFLLLVYIVPLPDKLNPSYSTVVKSDKGRILRIYLSNDEKRRIFYPLDNIDPLLVKSTIAYEDKYYFYHIGVNPFAIIRALYQDIRAKKIVSGASTIPMQLARICEPKPRTVKSKIIEMFRAIQFTVRLGKKKTLEKYLNLAPYGGNIEGVAAASVFYFGKLPNKLLPGEIAYLVSLPQSPNLRMPYAKKRRDARNKVLKRMLEAGLINKREYKKAFEIPPPKHFLKQPFLAPHFCNFVKNLYPDKRIIETSLKLDIQKKCENIAKSYKNYLFKNGATNLSIVVIDNKTSKVVAAVGSLDYFDRKNSGEIIGFNAFRSPGSTLKPFLYALALEKGTITIDSLIEDAPYNLNGFSPQNFSKKWSGLIKAEDALSLSLNMPFAIILKRTGYNNFVNKLEEGGVLGPLNKNAYGLAIITGGMDTKLIDLTNLYACFARGGIYKKWSVLKKSYDKSDKQIFRYGAVYLTLNALSKRNRPDAPVISSYALSNGRVFWKTGTSWGRRDALTIGFKYKYTVGVWSGNFNGKGNLGIVGSNLAAPIMFDIIKAIDVKGNKNLDWFYKGESDIEKVKVCAFSGFRPNENCPKIKEVYTVKGVVPVFECKFHKKFLIEKKTGKRACPNKQYKEGELKEEVFTVYPPLVRYILNKGYPPSYPRDCNFSAHGKIKIVSPINNSLIILPKGLSLSKEITLQAISTSKESDIYWFVNGKFTLTTKSGEKRFLKLKEGTYKIAATDLSSSTATIKIKIKREF